MASLKDNLIAARALIDTPEKWLALERSPKSAIYSVTDGWPDYSAAEKAFDAIRLRGFGYANDLATFDRAIAAAEVSP